MKSINEFKHFHVGDALTLSDLQTINDYNKTSVDFKIKETRHYQEPNNTFHFTGYVLEVPEDKAPLMVLVMEAGTVSEIRVYYLDSEHDASFDLPLIEKWTDDLAPRIIANVNDGKGNNREVIWDKQTSTFGVNFRDSTGSEGIVTIGDYFTNSENDGNNYCFLDWKGDSNKGHIEVWYGAIIQMHEIELMHTEEK